MKIFLVLFLAGCSSQTPRKPSSAREPFTISAEEGGHEIVAALKGATPALRAKLSTGDVDCADGFDMSPTSCMFSNPDGSPGPRVTGAAATSLSKLFDKLKRKAYPNGELDQLGIDSIDCTAEGSCFVKISPTGGAPERGGLL